MTLSTHALGVSRGARVLVRDLTVTMRPGEFWVVVGPNGAGKSTLCAALSGVLAPSAGEVRLQDRALSHWPSAGRARTLASLGQHETPDPDLTALDVVLLGRAPHVGAWGLAGPDELATARAALAEVDAAGLESRRMGTLSGGERQRVLLARAICTRAPVLVLDEPTEALDLRHAHAVLGLLRTLTSSGTLVVAVLHDLSAALRVGTHALLMGPEGALRAGPARQVLTDAHLSAAMGVSVRVVEAAGQPVVVVDAAPAA